MFRSEFANINPLLLSVMDSPSYLSSLSLPGVPWQRANLRPSKVRRIVLEVEIPHAVSKLEEPLMRIGWRRRQMLPLPRTNHRERHLPPQNKK